LSLVGSLNDTCGTYDVEPDGAVLEKILEVLVLAIDLIFHRLMRRNILKAVDRALYVAPVILQRANIYQGGNSGAVWTLDDNFCIPSGIARAHRIRHRAIRMRQRCSIQLEQTMGATKALL